MGYKEYLGDDTFIILIVINSCVYSYVKSYQIVMSITCFLLYVNHSFKKLLKNNSTEL